MSESCFAVLQVRLQLRFQQQLVLTFISEVPLDTEWERDVGHVPWLVRKLIYDSNLVLHVDLIAGRKQIQVSRSSLFCPVSHQMCLAPKKERREQSPIVWLKSFGPPNPSILRVLAWAIAAMFSMFIFFLESFYEHFNWTILKLWFVFNRWKREDCPPQVRLVGLKGFLMICCTSLLIQIWWSKRL